MSKIFEPASGVRTALFWLITQRGVVISYRTFRDNLSIQSSRVKNPLLSDSWPFTVVARN